MSIFFWNRSCYDVTADDDMNIPCIQTLK